MVGVDHLVISFVHMDGFDEGIRVDHLPSVAVVVTAPEAGEGLVSISGCGPDLVRLLFLWRELQHVSDRWADLIGGASRGASLNTRLAVRSPSRGHDAASKQVVLIRFFNTRY